jgi:hypothetical protein
VVKKHIPGTCLTFDESTDHKRYNVLDCYAQLKVQFMDQ